jgi:hypothetical protein
MFPHRLLQRQHGIQHHSVGSVHHLFALDALFHLPDLGQPLLGLHQQVPIGLPEGRHGIAQHMELAELVRDTREDLRHRQPD